MNAFKNKAKPGKPGGPSPQVKAKKISFISGGSLSPFYSAAPVLNLVNPLQNKMSVSQPNEQPRQQSGGHLKSSVGKPLPQDVREFFEPRFGHNFNNVNVHTGSSAVRMSAELKAQAFTYGNNIFFNQGKYNPGTSQGKHLLAHELTHVVQQNNPFARYPDADHLLSPSKWARPLIRNKSGNLMVQRADIFHRALTWEDFKGTAPDPAPHDAFTFTNIGEFGEWDAKEDTVDTQKKCQLDDTESTEFKVKVFIDPGLFDAVKAFMTQEESWVKRQFDDVDGYCQEKSSDCQQYFTKAFGQIEATCQQRVTECQEIFDKGNISYYRHFGSKMVTVTSRADCSTKLLEKCREFSKEGVSYSLTNKARGTTIANVTDPDQCGGVLLDKCKEFYNNEKVEVLKHEQGHFDITNVISQRTQTALKNKASQLVVEETRCGKNQARAAAYEAFNKLDPAKTLNDIFQKGDSLRKQAEEDYDYDTIHGIDETQQQAWETKIASGLPDYKIVP